MIGTRRNKRLARRSESGQGLVEFALVLPALLLTLMGIADFGRLFAVYSNLFNAAREGARYGVVNPKNVPGITMAARTKINLIEGDEADIFVEYDSGPGTPLKDFDTVTIGDRVIVTVSADVELFTPFIRPIVEKVRVETVGRRTISTLGEVGTGEADPLPPTPIPSPTPSPTPTSTPVPGAPTPTPAPIEIDVPLWEGDEFVTGVGQPGGRLTLRDLQVPYKKYFATVRSDGTFEFLLPFTLTAGHVIEVTGYGSIDYGLVVPIPLPTATPVPTASPTPTPVPSTQYIEIAPICGPAVTTTLAIKGYQWPVDQGYLAISWDGTEVERVDPPSANFAALVAVAPSVGTHSVSVATQFNSATYNNATNFVAPCPIPNQANLVVERVTLDYTGVLTTHNPLTFTVDVRNIGAAATKSLFWVDLYLDPTAEPPTPSDLASETSAAWAAAGLLLANETISLTLPYPQGLATLGAHSVYAMADSWDQVSEFDELDNVSEPLSVTVEMEGTVPPMPTPTPTPGGIGTGGISGSTWLHFNSTFILQGRVNVYVYEGAELVAETLSDPRGEFSIESLPVGVYTVVGEMYIGDVLYSDMVLQVEVIDGWSTDFITLVLN
jgi:hypothetical protein